MSTSWLNHRVRNMSSTKKSQDTEKQILNAAKKVFQKKGMDGARMQEIADEAGINKAMLHYYFRSKQVLFETVFRNAFDLLAPQLNKILNDDSTIEEKVKNFTHNYISFIAKHPYLPNFIIQEMNRNPKFFEEIQPNIELPTLDKFNAQVDLEVEQGILKPIDGKQLLINIISLNIFPFLASPLIKEFLRIDNKEFKELLEERKKAVSSFIINSIKK